MGRYRRGFQLYQIAAWHQFVILTGWATYLSLVPSPGEVFTTVWDKLLHVLAWSVLTFSLRIAWPVPRFPWWAALGLFLYSVLVESLQHLVPERSFSVEDLLANGLGVAVAFGVAAVIWPPVEAHLIRRLR
ncbi:VanZ family protein [Gilvimarinus sp. F26214L]|uniref:VanZ family protein n=1 Tax=Gilvimarinus sp. DZF01 TaxID=3461371 RepID=UPI004045B169